jgi:hypothetical protein
MKRALLLGAAILFLAGSTAAVPPPIGYIGVFADGAHSIAYLCPAQYEQFQAWIWILPGTHGVQAAEFAVSFPATTLVLATVQHPNITVALGALSTGISVSFGEAWCQTDWVWTHHLTMMSLAVVQTWIAIIPHPRVLPVPAYHVATCELGYPIERLSYLTPLYLCQSWGVEESSWGAIKSLF